MLIIVVGVVVVLAAIAAGFFINRNGFRDGSDGSMTYRQLRSRETYLANNPVPPPLFEAAATSAVALRREDLTRLLAGQIEVEMRGLIAERERLMGDVVRMTDAIERVSLGRGRFRRSRKDQVAAENAARELLRVAEGSMQQRAPMIDSRLAELRQDLMDLIP